MVDIAADLGYSDIRAHHAHVLANVGVRGIRLTELAARAQLGLAAASEFVTELENLGYLERRSDPKDSRAKLILLTRKGRQGFKDGEKRVAQIERHWAALVGDARFAQSFLVLEEIVDRLSAEASSESAPVARRRREAKLPA
jgi:DNA-binding MarR family transcriptional regulator